jgi:hypothetical protein
MEEKPKYITIIEQYDKQLIKAVNEKMAQGYEPYGNIALAFDGTGMIKAYVQTMMLKK